MTGKLNRKSKRMTTSKKQKIMAKISEHRRKLRKEDRKNTKKFKDPGIPNSLPFRDEIIRVAEQCKKRAKDLKEAQRSSRIKLQMGNRGLDEMIDEANKIDDEFDAVSKVEEESGPKENSTNHKSYFKELKKVVEAADIIMEVLDARDPLGSRSALIEEKVISSGKKLVLILNKIDLIPRQNLDEWLKYLRQSLPTVAFKASTQSQNSNLSQSKVAAPHITESLQGSSRCVGGSFLMKVLGNYCRNQGIQTSIKVGVVGFPNVGKSSVINSLKRCRSCSVGATPGLTKTVQEVAIDKHIKILDSPGVVFAKDSCDSNLALRNALKVEKLGDVIAPAEAIVQRADHKELCLHYKLPEFSSSHELLCLLAKRMGKFKKGGIPNVDEGARRLINDWNRGIIKYYTHPPEVFKPDVYISTCYVKELSKAFDIDSLEEQMELDKAYESFSEKHDEAGSKGIAHETASMHDDSIDTTLVKKPKKVTFKLDENMEIDQKNVTVDFEKKKNKKDETLEKKLDLSHFQQNKVMKKKFKKMKKNKKRADKMATALSASLDSALSLIKC